MSNYECQQCKETSVLPFAGGKCSKCGSLNIKKLNQQKRKTQKNESGKKSILVILLWGFIIYELWRRLYT